MRGGVCRDPIARRRLAAKASPSPAPAPSAPAPAPAPAPASPFAPAPAPAPTPAPAPAQPPPPPLPPILLLQTADQRCLTTALEAGRLAAAVFTRDTLGASKAWRKLARFEALFLDEEEGELSRCDGGDGGGDGGGKKPAVVGRWRRVRDAAALRAAEASLAFVGAKAGLRYVVMDALPDATTSTAPSSSSSSAAWRVIPSENLVAFAQQQPWWRRGGPGGGSVLLLATCATAAEAGALLGSLEAGTDGVVLRTDDPREVRLACAALDARARASARPLLSSARRPPPSPPPPPPGADAGVGALHDHRQQHQQQHKHQQQRHQHPAYDCAVVTRVEPVGMADRACVDLACALGPGEGLLVGCFARALFLVASERDDAGYVPARPFRVNAGPLAQYVLASAGGGGDGGGGGGRTKYLSELRVGQSVAVAGADGRLARGKAVVARVKVESRPVVLVEAETEAEEGGEEAGGAPTQKHAVLLQNAETVKLVGPAEGGGAGAGGLAWRTVSVAELAPGDRVYVLRQPAARHTGLAIDEGVSER